MKDKRRLAIRAPEPGTDRNVDQMLKMCSRCGLEKPVTEFYRNASKPDGFSNQCRDCHHQSVRIYRLKKRNPNALAMRLTWEQPRILPRGFRRCANVFCSRILEDNEYNFPQIDGQPSAECRRCLAIRVELEEQEAIRLAQMRASLNPDPMDQPPAAEK